MELYIVSGTSVCTKSIKMYKTVNPLNLRWKSPPVHKEEEELHVQQGVPRVGGAADVILSFKWGEGIWYWLHDYLDLFVFKVFPNTWFKENIDNLSC